MTPPGAAGPLPHLQTRLDALLVPLAGLLVTAGVILLGALVAELAAPLAAGAHHDFLAFYAAGKLVLDGNPGGLYQGGALSAIQRTIIPSPVGANGYMPFINPPFAAVAFAPLAALPAQAARAVWAFLSLLLLAAAGAWIARALPPLRRALGVLLLVLSFPAYHSLAEGQWSAVMLLGGLAALQAARQGSWRLAGLALATWWLKPQLIALPLLALVVDRRWSAVAWSIIGGAGLTLASLPFAGVGSYVTYVGYLVQVGVSHFNGAGAVARSVWQGNLSTAEGLNGLLVGIFGQGAVVSVDLWWAGLTAGLVAVWLIAARLQRPGFDSEGSRRMLAAGIGIVLLTNPNLFVQDCVLVFLLVPALSPSSAQGHWRASVGVAALAAITLVDQPLASHLFTVVLLGVVLALMGTAVRGAAGHGAAGHGAAGQGAAVRGAAGQGAAGRFWVRLPRALRGPGPRADA
ncbi:MAG: glycosyltransferase 87 family protein [Candidatus Limnocylindrales bacterium]